MNYWRMTFRVGSLNQDLWPECYDRGIASIGEYNEDGEGVPNLRHLSESEFANLWNRGDFTSVTARMSLFNLRFRMTTGDVIYTKGPKEIIGCGVVVSEYNYDPNIMEGTADWEHFVRVKWNPDFKPIKALLGAERLTLLHLNGTRLDYLSRLLKESGQALKVTSPSGEIVVPSTEQNHTIINSQQAGLGCPPQDFLSPVP